MPNDDGTMVLLPGEGKTVRLPGNEITYIRRGADSAYSLVKWVAAPGTPLHIHWITDEAFYVLDGTFGFKVGERTVDGVAGLSWSCLRDWSMPTGTRVQRQPVCS